MWHLVKYNTTVAVNFSNSTLGNSDRQYTIILFISNTPDATILNYLHDRERGHHYLLQDFDAPQCPPPPTTSPDPTIRNNLNDRGGGAPLYL